VEKSEKKQVKDYENFHSFSFSISYRSFIILKREKYTKIMT